MCILVQVFELNFFRFGHRSAELAKQLELPLPSPALQAFSFVRHRNPAVLADRLSEKFAPNWSKLISESPITLPNLADTLLVGEQKVINRNTFLIGK